MLRREGIPALTGLRFFAAGAVFVSHALPKIVPLPPNNAVPAVYTLLESAAGVGMTLFFVLSGFVIHYNYSAQIRYQGARGLFNFFVARFARLYPLYLCGLTFELLHKYSYSQVPESLNQALPFYLTLTQTWIYFTYGENALVYQFGIISSLAWSISTEWFFYCAYPFICYGLSCFARTQDKFMIAILTCVVAVGLIVTVGRFADPINEFAVSQFGAIADKARWQDSFLRWLLSFSPYSRIFEFLLGCICAAIYLDMADRVPTRTEERRGLLLLACAIVAIVALHIFFYAPTILRPRAIIHPLFSHLRWLNLSFGLAPPIAIVLFCCARYKTALTRFLSTKADRSMR